MFYLFKSSTKNQNEQSNGDQDSNLNSNLNSNLERNNFFFIENLDIFIFLHRFNLLRKKDLEEFPSIKPYDFHDKFMKDLQIHILQLIQNLELNNYKSKTKSTNKNENNNEDSTLDYDLDIENEDNLEIKLDNYGNLFQLLQTSSKFQQNQILVMLLYVLYEKTYNILLNQKKITGCIEKKYHYIKKKNNNNLKQIKIEIQNLIKEVDKSLKYIYEIMFFLKKTAKLSKKYKLETIANYDKFNTLVDQSEFLELIEIIYIDLQRAFPFNLESLFLKKDENTYLKKICENEKIKKFIIELKLKLNLDFLISEDLNTSLRTPLQASLSEMNISNLLPIIFWIFLIFNSYFNIQNQKEQSNFENNENNENNSLKPFVSKLFFDTSKIFGQQLKFPISDEKRLVNKMLKNYLKEKYNTEMLEGLSNKAFLENVDRIEARLNYYDFKDFHISFAVELFLSSNFWFDYLNKTLENLDKTSETLDTSNLVFFPELKLFISFNEVNSQEKKDAYHKMFNKITNCEASLYLLFLKFDYSILVDFFREINKLEDLLAINYLNSFEKLLFSLKTPFEIKFINKNKPLDLLDRIEFYQSLILHLKDRNYLNSYIYLFLTSVLNFIKINCNFND